MPSVLRILATSRRRSCSPSSWPASCCTRSWRAAASAARCSACSGSWCSALVVLAVRSHAGADLGRRDARRAGDGAAADPGGDRQRRAAAVLVGARGGPVLLRRRRADRLHARRPRDHPRRAVRGRRDVHARGLGLRLRLRRLAGDRAAAASSPAIDPTGERIVDGAAVPELHDAVEHRAERRRAGAGVRAQPRDDRAARGRRVHRGRGLPARRPDGPAPDG